MKNIKIPIYLVMAFLLLLSPSAFADDSFKDVINSILNYGVHIDPSKDNVEYFQIWLSYIFGTFIYDVETGNSGTVSALAHALGFTNILALFFGFVMISYVFAGGALNSAHSGEVLGKNWSSVWMPIRTSIGIGFIMPAPAFGAGVLSFAQIAVIWLVIFGSNAASFLWGNSVDKMVNYGVFGNVSQNIDTEFVSSVSKIMVCLDHHAKYSDFEASGGVFPGVLVHYKDPSQFTDSSTVVNNNSEAPTEKSYKSLIESIELSLIEENADTYEHRIKDISPIIKFIKKSNVYPTKIVIPSCGEIKDIPSLSDAQLTASKAGAGNNILTDVSLEGTASEDSYKVLLDVYSSYIENYLSPALIASWSSSAEIGSINSGDPNKAIVALQPERTATKNKELARKTLITVADRIANASNDYNKGYTTLKKEHFDGVEKLKSKDTSEYKKGGWASAGLWFIKIGRLERSVGSTNYSGSSTYTGTEACIVTENGGWMSSIPFTDANKCINANARMNASLELLSYAVDASKGSTKIVTANKTQNAGGGSQLYDGATTCDSLSCSGMSTRNFMSKVAQGGLNILAMDMFGTHDIQDSSSSSVNGGFFSATGLQNPFNTLQNIGTNLNNLGATAMAVYGVAKIGLKMAETAADTPFTSLIKSGATGLLTALENMGMFLIPVVMAVFTSGFIMAYLIPFLPVLAWINMMVGYLITVIEAVTAAPLAVVQLLTPEGQGILGSRLERAMQLIVIIIVKPSLMIIGLLSAIVMGSIAFSIFNTFFWEATYMYLGTVGIIDFVAILIIYTSSAVTLTKLVVSIMYTLPNHILEWFAGNAARSFGEEQTGHALESANKGLESATNTVSSGVTSQIRHNERLKQSQSIQANQSENGDSQKTPDSKT